MRTNLHFSFCHVLEDEQFLEWIASKRNNKRILKQLEIEEDELEELRIV